MAEVDLFLTELKIWFFFDLKKINFLGIPVVIHKEFQKYIPELIFGELLTGSNFDDTDLKYIGGRNGLGTRYSLQH